MPDEPVPAPDPQPEPRPPALVQVVLWHDRDERAWNVSQRDYLFRELDLPRSAHAYRELHESVKDLLRNAAGDPVLLTYSRQPGSPMMTAGSTDGRSLAIAIDGWPRDDFRSSRIQAQERAATPPAPRTPGQIDPLDCPASAAARARRAAMANPAPVAPPADPPADPPTNPVPVAQEDYPRPADYPAGVPLYRSAPAPATVASEEVVGEPEVRVLDAEGRPAPQRPRALRQENLVRFRPEDFAVGQYWSPQIPRRPGYPVLFLEGPCNGYVGWVGGGILTQDVILTISIAGPNHRRAEYLAINSAMSLTFRPADGAPLQVHTMSVMRWNRNH